MTERPVSPSGTATLSALDTSVAGGDAWLLEAIDRALHASRFRLRFEQVLEDRFEADTREKRIHDIRRTIILGLVVFHIYNLAAFVTTPDLAQFNVALRVVGMTPIAFLIVWAVGRVSGPVREAVGGFGMLLATFIPILIFWLGTGPLVSLTTATIWLSVVFANISLPLRFFWACFVSGITALAVLAGLYVKPEIAGDVAGVLGLDMVTGILFSLVATYRIESASRRDYLVNLRETLRANRLAADNSTLALLSSTDSLTGIPNRRAFMRELGEFWQASQAGRPFAVMLIDVDHFKRFNDHYGHGAGDACLRAVAGILARIAASAGGFVCRYGGEEFAVLVEAGTTEDALALADRLRRSILEQGLVHGNRSDGLSRISVSIGLATSCGPVTSSATLVEAADMALYEAKAAGRNRICQGSRSTEGESGTPARRTIARWPVMEEWPMARAG